MSKEFKEFTKEEVQQWVIIDAKVYDLSRFANLHPGGRAVLVDGAVAGQDATEAFYGLHRHEVLERPQYARLQIGVLRGEQSVITGRLVGGISGVPFAEPTYLSKGFHSPYYTENHKAFQKTVRKFFDEVREIDGKRPSQEVLTRWRRLIITQEMIRTGARGYADALLGGKVIGLPPIVPEVFAAKKFICLAISEAHAGSDVLGMKTTAKKWITNGHFTTGCRPSDFDPRQEGVTTKIIKTSYSPTAGTAFITFDNVRVPVENTLGPEGGGIFVILSNFNHERWVMVCASARAQRMIVEECLKWVSQRKAFGKPLSSQAVVRAKLAAMIARAEAMCNMSYKEQSTNLAGQIAFLKMYSTQCAQDTARDATGMGRFIEHASCLMTLGYHRTVTFDSILGGAEDVLGDLGVRQAIRAMPKNAGFSV
ncbi:acyl-CoA dehydrogenase/oxidase [Russula vinacea]|nr:acyl-CoA dehydrogenase/oxidase [Russula vinacea]